MKETVIQFGEGNFLRGFFDYFLHELNERGLYDGKAVIVQPRAGGKVQGLTEQGCKYNLYLRGIEKGETRCEHTLVESVARCIDPYKNFEGFIALADNPDFRFIVSNTTEAGISFDDTCRLEDKPCLSFPGKVTQLLYRRYKNNLGGFILLPCELIDNNGDELKKCVLKYAQLWSLEAEFAQWVENENYFANTLVDRIVTGFPTDETASLHPEDKYINTAEIFHLWVIEGDFESELPLKKCGFNVIWTNDVKPYKKIKVRILNGAHTSLVAGALLSGIETVGEAMADATAYSFLCKAMNEEILPAIGDNNESRTFAESVFDRFKNPYIHHRWEAISLNSISKFSVRVLPTLLEYREKFGEYPDCLSLSLAYLLYYYKNKNPQDSQATIAFIKENSISDILKNKELWQGDISALTEKIEGYYSKIEEIGPKEAMKWIL